MTPRPLPLLLALLLLGACAKVPAWDRGLLVTPVMAVEPGLEEAMDAHVDGTREVMRGADGAGGAPCGC